MPGSDVDLHQPGLERVIQQHVEAEQLKTGVFHAQPQLKQADSNTSEEMKTK